MVFVGVFRIVLDETKCTKATKNIKKVKKKVGYSGIGLLYIQIAMN